MLYLVPVVVPGTGPVPGILFVFLCHAGILSCHAGILSCHACVLGKTREHEPASPAETCHHLIMSPHGAMARDSLIESRSFLTDANKSDS